MTQMQEPAESKQQMRFDEVETVQQMSPEAVRETIAWRIELNMRETGHPFHHKTASGTIVSTDPTLDALVNRLTDAAPAVPVIHDWYTTEAGMAFLRTRVERM